MRHEEISQKYCKWLIEYQSIEFEEKIYFIWLTDISKKEHLDLMLLSKQDKILTNTNPQELIRLIKKNNENLPDSKNLYKWLNESCSCEELSSNKYHVIDLQKSLNKEFISSSQLELIINLINLLDDYNHQINEKFNNIRKNNKELDLVWEFYYNEIFFKQENQKDIATTDKTYPNSEKLKEECMNLISEFESKFECNINK